MNKEQLLDAIGMVDEQKIQDAVTFKRTKRLSGMLAVSVVLFAAAVLILLYGGLRYFFHEETIAYPPSHIARDIAGANTVTVFPDPADPQTRYTLYVPDGTNNVMRFDEWNPAEPRDTKDLNRMLVLKFHGVSLTFYDGGYVVAQKHDWDNYIGHYTVPEDRPQELLAFLDKQ